MELKYTQIAAHRLKYIPETAREEIVGAFHAFLAQKEWIKGHVQEVEPQGEGEWFAMWFPAPFVCFLRFHQGSWEVTSIENAMEYKAWKAAMKDANSPNLPPPVPTVQERLDAVIAKWG